MTLSRGVAEGWEALTRAILEVSRACERSDGGSAQTAALQLEALLPEARVMALERTRASAGMEGRSRAAP